MSTPREVDGQLTATGRRFALVVARFNAFIVEQLVSGAVDTITRHGGRAEDITIYRVPGSWELPLAVQRTARTGRFDAVVALGAVIRGATPHFDYVAGEAVKGLGAIALQEDVPVTFGVLTCDTIEQAIERAGTKAGNKGGDAALAAIEMVDLLARVAED